MIVSKWFYTLCKNSYTFLSFCKRILLKKIGSSALQQKPNFSHLITELASLSPTNHAWIHVPFQDSLSVNREPTPQKLIQDPGIQRIEILFNQISQQIPYTNPQQLIPSIIHFIWLGSSLPLHVQHIIDSWAKHHPSWELKIWTDNVVAALQWKNTRARVLFEQETTWGGKSDSLRLEILDQFGGIYVDSDFFCLRSFAPVVSQNNIFFAGIGENTMPRFQRPLIYNGLMGSIANNPLLQRCIQYMRSRREDPFTFLPFRSGPGPLTRACYQTLAEGESRILILPCSYIYPLPWGQRCASWETVRNTLRPESLAVHLWESSWEL